MGQADRTLQLLAERPAAFSFVDAVQAVLDARPGAAPPAGPGMPADEAVRFRPHLSLAFPAADVQRAEALPPDAAGVVRWRLETTFLGLYGQATPLAPYLTERLFNDDGGVLRDFIDIFDHRLLSLAWRVLTRYRIERTREHDARLRALAGAAPDQPMPSLPGERDMLEIAGLLSQQPRSASGLAAAISTWLGVTAEIEQCVPVWTDLPPERQARMGQANCGLGSDMLAGERLLSRGSAFVVRVGPLPPERLSEYLPGGYGLAAVSALVAEFNDQLLDWRLEVVLAGGSIPPAALGGGARLGWDTRCDGPASGDAIITVAPEAA
jgi:type VI secretion system protein ImpH